MIFFPVEIQVCRFWKILQDTHQNLAICLQNHAVHRAEEQMLLSYSPMHHNSLHSDATAPMQLSLNPAW